VIRGGGEGWGNVGATRLGFLGPSKSGEVVERVGGMRGCRKRIKWSRSGGYW